MSESATSGSAMNKHWRSWLVTVGVLIAYLWIAPGTLEACKSLHADLFVPSDLLLVSVLLGPPLCALGATVTMLYLTVSRSPIRNTKGLWLLLLFGAFLGWPVSFFTGAIMNDHGSWLMRC